MLSLANTAVAYAAPDPLTAPATQINTKSNIDALNAEPSSWVAGHNEFFANKTFGDAKLLLGALFPSEEERAALHAASDLSHLTSVKDVPAAFDAREKWGKAIQPIRDQQQCGSCWAFSAAEVLSDRFSMATGKSVVLSPEQLVSCDKGDQGCQGGRLSSAWDFLTKTGTVSDKCFPYTAGKGTAPACATKCVPFGGDFTEYKSQGGYTLNSPEDMQKEIFANGPVQVAFSVYKSFMSYKSGVYTKKFWELLPEGGHAVKVVGWGTENSEDYWLVANSWNTNWGLDGYFKIARGKNECGIEKMGPPTAGLPAVSLDAKSGDTCSLYIVAGATCGQSDLDCAYVKYAKLAEKDLKDGTCAAQGYSVKGSTTTKHYPVIGDIVVTEYTK